MARVGRVCLCGVLENAITKTSCVEAIDRGIMAARSLAARSLAALDPAYCPGSPAGSPHAGCYLTVAFADTPCTRVRNETLARIAAGPSFDSHNHGTYSLISDDDDASGHTYVIVGQRVTGAACQDCYTDRFQLTLTQQLELDGTLRCFVHACSESQGPSVFDYSTNYCNLRVLWCGASDSCPSVGEPSFDYVENIISCAAGHTQQHAASACVPEARSHPPPAPRASINGLLKFVGISAGVLFGIVAFCICLKLFYARRRGPPRPLRSASAEGSTSTSSAASASGLGPDAAGGEWELNDAAKAALENSEYKMGDAKLGEAVAPVDEAAP